MDPLEIVDRLVEATNAHDLDGIVECFAGDYVNETPAHPPRGFVGRDQVRRNWTAILAGVPDIHTRVLATAVVNDRVWTEWEMTGTRHDGAPHSMAGVVIFTVYEDRITSARFYLEPVEASSGDVNAAIERTVGPAS